MIVLDKALHQGCDIAGHIAFVIRKQREGRKCGQACEISRPDPNDLY